VTIFNIRRTPSPPANTGGTVTSRFGRVRRPSLPTRSSTTFGYSSAKRLKELEVENARLKKLLAEAELDKAMLKELAEGKW